MAATDLIGLCEALSAGGVSVPAIQFPADLPSGRVLLKDPDRYRVTVCHWGRTEQLAWEQRIK